jgi:phosphatidate cytidylyltransferase
MASIKGYQPLTYPGMSVLGLYLLAQPLSLALGLPWLPIAILGFGCALLFFLTQSPEHSAIRDLGITVFGILYLAFPFSCLLDLASGSMGSPVLWLTMALVLTKLGDTGAYFVGRAFGRIPFSPVLSPKKTVEGLIGAVLLSSLAGSAFATWGPSVWPILSDFGLVELGGLAAMMALVGQIGDLAESSLKRDAGIKDSNQIPGLGGILDLLDSLLFTVPFLYFYLHAR